MTSRRNAFAHLGVAVAALGLGGSATASPSAPHVLKGAKSLDALTGKLASFEPRRDFKTVPMILVDRADWDADALDAVLHYAGGPKQSWDNTDLAGPWLNVMRNAMNSQVWSFGHADFLCVSATHSSAQLALYDDVMWDKYSLAKGAAGGVTKNSFVAAKPASSVDAADFQNEKGAFSPAANSIQGLQRRGAVFLACHNAAWELSERLIASGANPDKLSTGALCAELTNHLVPGVIMTPGAVGTLVELATAGFSYAR